MKQLNQTLSQIRTAYGLRPPLQVFDLPAAGLNHTTLGLRTGDGELFLKLYRAPMDEASLDYEHALLRHVVNAELSFDVPAPLATREGAFRLRVPSGWATLAPFFAGRSPELRLSQGRRKPEAPAEAEALGAAIGELHVALVNAPLIRRPGNNLFDALFAFPPPERAALTLTPAQAGLGDRAPYSGLLAWWRDEAAELAAFVNGQYRALPRQVCHNDMSPANVLVRAERVTAVLDWEFATVAARALDVAMGLRLVMQTWDDPAPWHMVRRFFAGYTRYTRMTPTELEALPLLLRLRNTIPGLWWLGGGGAHDNAAHFEQRIASMQQLSRWLHRNWDQLAETILE